MDQSEDVEYEQYANSLRRSQRNLTTRNQGKRGFILTVDLYSTLVRIMPLDIQRPRL